MREYATQMEAARRGIVTEELKKVAAKERMTPEELMPLVAEGKVAICANKNHTCIDPEGVGSEPPLDTMFIFRLCFLI